jgi:hypothetical protein
MTIWSTKSLQGRRMAKDRREWKILKRREERGERKVKKRKKKKKKREREREGKEKNKEGDGSGKVAPN